MKDIYTDDSYLRATGGTWHAEDSLWKASNVLDLLDAHDLVPDRVLEVGCGAGRVLGAMAADARFANSMLDGFDISPQAIELARRESSAANVRFICGDPLAGGGDTYDLLLALDVFEHVPDYLGFLQSCARAATYKIYHVPLDIYVSSVLRNAFLANRAAVGHLHYFTAESALATLRDTGHEIVDVRYTDSFFSLSGEHPSWRRRLGNLPRRVFARVDVPMTARVFGGWSLLVLTR